MKNDTTWIQFHDASADAETAWAQAARAHERMGISDVGGYLQHDYVFETSISGVYKEADRTLTISRSSEPLPQVELLDLCAYRAHMRGDAKQPIERIRVLFWDERTRDGTCTSCGCASSSAGTSTRRVVRSALTTAISPSGSCPSGSNAPKAAHRAPLR